MLQMKHVGWRRYNAAWLHWLLSRAWLSRDADFITFVTVCSMGHQHKVCHKACIMKHVALPICFCGRCCHKRRCYHICLCIQTMGCTAP